MKNRLGRRQFLKTAAAAGTGLVVLKDPRSAWGAPANERLNLALVGVGGRGTWFVGAIPRMNQNVVAICDVNDVKAAEALEKFPKVPRFYDYRTMLDEMDKSIDGVIVATPDSMHAPVSAEAMRRGKHVYCEKPLTKTVHEARVLRQMAREKKVATQMGNQGTASGPFRRALELLREGAIGDLKEVRVWNNGGGSNKPRPPEGSQPAPEYLKWDLWLGPAAERPYHREWMQWHAWRDFATGALGNWGAHSANLAFMALEVASLWAGGAASIRVEARISGLNRHAFPAHETVRWDVPARGTLPPISFHWHNGGENEYRKVIEPILDDGKKLEWAGLVIVGSRGKLHATGHNATFRLLPEASFQGADRQQPKSLPHSPGHEMEWIRACRGEKPAWSNFDYSGPLTEFLLLGNVATLVEGPIEYDPAAGKITNSAEADRLLRREYRAGWTL
jgi:predicted dehydrogenase